MKLMPNSLLKRMAVGLIAVLLPSFAALAFPPAPSVLIYGLVRDQYGNPLNNTADLVILQTPGGMQVVTPIQPNLAIGVNYALQVPMDSDISPPLYVSNALIAGEQYTLLVVNNGTTNLPLEMAGQTFFIGAPSSIIQQNLTLGTNSIGDGIPTSWATALLQSLGLNISPTNINPNGVYTSDGRTLYQEYLLGNYPYNSNAFAVTIVSQNAGSAVISFTTTADRTYTVLGSANLATWTPLAFTVPSVSAQAVNSYVATSIQPLQFQTVQPTNLPPFQFFKLSLH